MWPSWRSSGAATEDAMISGLAPGSAAPPRWSENPPAAAAPPAVAGRPPPPPARWPTVSSVCHRPADEWRGNVHAAPRRMLPALGSGFRREARKRQPVEEQIDHRRGVERQHLADDQAADDGDAERLAQFRADAGAQRQRQAAEQRGEGGHHDRPEAQQARLIDRLAGACRRCAPRRARSRSS
jgi:hypothetical protein